MCRSSHGCRFAAFLAFMLSCGLLLSGCGQTDPRVTALRQQLVLAEEPAGAASIADAREQTHPSSPDGEPPASSSQGEEIVVVGRIHAGEFEPWAKGEAAFLISEALPDSAHEGSPDHDPANCPFCRRRAEKAESVTALIQFRDEQGNVVPIDARELLGVEQNQIVVVRGRGHVDQLGVLIIAADGIHIRK